MKLSKSLKIYLEAARKTDSYWVEKAKLDFSISLDSQREFTKISYADIAKRLGSSPAYISKVFRGESNLTIESMVKLARSAGGQVEIRIVDNSAAVSRWDFTLYKPSKVAAISRNSFTSFQTDAANHAVFDWESAYA